MKQIIFLHEKRILYFKADGSYTIAYMDNGEKKIITRRLSRVELNLLSERFFRCHNSYLINIDQIKSIQLDRQTSITMNNSDIIKVAYRKNGAFKKFLASQFLIMRSKSSSSVNN